MDRLVWSLAQGLGAGLAPFLVPLCTVLAWSLVGLTLWQCLAITRESLHRAQVMHQIPCARCRYFTNNPLLKCPVHPQVALSEEAIGCGDYETTAWPGASP
ncbi:MAG: hypothetical protein ACKO4L_02115 [Nodosilinea sp.]